LAVLENTHENILARKGISATTFNDEYCATMQSTEQWVGRMRRSYGGLCQLAFFTRCEKFLQSNRARPMLYNCLRVGCKLESDAADGPGLEQCRTVLAELEKLKTKTKEEVPAAGSAGAGAVKWVGAH
jgi:hypothetical protein